MLQCGKVSEIVNEIIDKGKQEHQQHRAGRRNEFEVKFIFAQKSEFTAYLDPKTNKLWIIQYAPP